MISSTEWGYIMNTYSEEYKIEAVKRVVSQ
jgi:hypothetical protein